MRPFLAMLVMLTACLGHATAATSGEPCLKTHILNKPTKTAGLVTDADIKVTLKLEIASTPEARKKGLMERTNLGSCDGMAFWFPKLATEKMQFSSQSFWMKNTHIPLDILFIDDKNRIVAIKQGKPLSTDSITHEGQVASVIELQVGQAKELGILIGDRVLYEISGPTHLLAH